MRSPVVFGTHDMSLVDLLSDAGELTGQVADVVSVLQDVATGLDDSRSHAALRAISEELASDTFELVVAGASDNGKPALIGSLVGDLTRDVPELAAASLSPAGVLPVAAVPTRLSYAAEPSVKVVYKDGRTEPWTLSRFLADSKLTEGRAEDERFFGSVREFHVGLPVELCRERVSIRDFPGLDDERSRDDATLDAVRSCDAAIILLDVRRPATSARRAFLADVERRHTKVFIVVNSFGEEIGVDLIDAVWLGVVDPDGDEPQPDRTPKDLAGKDVFMIDVRAAEQARRTGDRDRAVRSGMVAFEERLGSYLVHERVSDHLVKFIDRARDQIAILEDGVARRRSAVLHESADLKKAGPGLDDRVAAARRLVQEEIPGRFRRCTAVAREEVLSSLQAAVVTLRLDMADELMRLDIPSFPDAGAGRRLAAVRKGKIAEELSANVMQVVTERLDAWRSTAQDIVARHVEGLLDEIDAEVSEAVGRFRSLRGEIGAITFSHTSTEVRRSRTTRFLRGTAVLGGMTVGLGAPEVLPAMILAGVVAVILNRKPSKQKLVDKAVQKYDEQLAGRPLVDAETIGEGVSEVFAEVERAVTAQVRDLLASEETRIRAARRQDEEHARRRLEDDDSRLDGARAALVVTRSMATTGF
jgi:hypothetical protein